MENDPYIKTADMCWQMARYLAHRAAHGSGISQEQKQIAECEVVCVLFHFLNRILFQEDPSSSDSRMASLATAAVRLRSEAARNAVPRPPSDPITYDPPDYGADNKVVTREMYEESVYRLREIFYEDRLTSATADATETFMNLLSNRMVEYNHLQRDWIPRLLTKFGKNFSAAIDPENVSLETFFLAEQEVAPMFVALGDFVPALLAAPAT